LYLNRDIGDPDYIEARFDIGVEDVTREQLEAELNGFLRVGAIGQLRIKQIGFSIQDMGSK
jgi:hypothetical protein